jgi:hypothetical protein
MTYELIPFPISIILVVVFVLAWIVILWKLRRSGTVYSILFKASLIAGVVLLAAFIFSIIANMLG